MEIKRSDLLEELNLLFDESYSYDASYIRTCRDWLRLYNGAHFKRGVLGSFNDSGGVNDYYEYSADGDSFKINSFGAKRLQISENRIQPVIDDLSNFLLSYCGEVRFKPYSDKDVEDEVLSRLYNVVLKFLNQKLDLAAVKRKAAKIVASSGEVWVEVIWDRNAGELLGFEDGVEEGEQTPIFSGGFYLKFIDSSSIRRPIGIKRLEDADWLGYEEVATRAEMEEIIQHSSLLDEGYKETMLKDIRSANLTRVFWADNGYGGSNHSDYLRRIYYKPCVKYPYGRVMTWYNDYMLEDEPLPEELPGLPLIFCTYDSLPDSARGHSHIDNLRSSQVEINRIQTRITDVQAQSRSKLIANNAGEFSKGSSLAGTDLITASGVMGDAPITHIKAETGQDYLLSKEANIKAFNELSRMPVKGVMPQQSSDLMASLYLAGKERFGFHQNMESFASFNKKLVSYLVEASKYYYEDFHLEGIVGEYELVNLELFKNDSAHTFDVSLETVTTDPDSQFKKHLEKSAILQYAGSNPKVVEAVVSDFSFGGLSDSLKVLRVQSDIQDNLLVALSEGREALISEFMQLEPLLEKVELEMTKPSFLSKSDDVKRAFQVTRERIINMISENAKKAAEAERKGIPMDGPPMKIRGFLVPRPGKAPTEAVLPADLVQWALDFAEKNGMSQERIQGLTEDAINKAEAAKNSVQPSVAQPRGQGSGIMQG